MFEEQSFATAMGRSHKHENCEGGNFTILIAEDNEVNLQVLQAMLSNFHVKLLIAKDGRKAVSLFKAKHVDLVLMDINMPLMDGFEATKNIRSIERSLNHRPTPIIAVTAHVKPADQHICIAASMNDYLHKPIRADDLKQSFRIWAPELVCADAARYQTARSAS